MNTYQPSDAELEMIRIMKSEKTSWEDGQVFVTDKVAFIMRNVVKQARKNFFGIYEEENDPVTGRKKIWVPLTEWTVENVLKNIDIDTDAVRCEPMKPESSVACDMLNHLLRNRLGKAEFGKLLNATISNAVVDGTGYLKAWKEKGELKIGYTDSLHIIADPSVQRLDESPSIIEENILSLPEFQMYGWDNSDYVVGSKNVDRTGIAETSGSKASNSAEIPYVRVYERYGWAPKYVLTGDEEDRDEYVYVLSIVSEIDTNPVVHVVKKVKGHPYQDFKLKEVLNRLFGRGIPEKLFEIQKYVNETVNTRVGTARIAQMGLWRVGDGVNSKQVKELFSTSAIRAKQGDIERLNTGSVDASSYKDEEVSYEWAKRVTQTTNEDEMTASQPATNALIQEKGANKGYNLIMENLYMDLAKFMKEKVIPIIIETLKDGEIEKITGDPAAISKLEEPYARNAVRTQNAKAFMETGRYLYAGDAEETRAVDDLMERTNRTYGNRRFIPIVKAAFDTEYEVRIDPANDIMNKAVVSQQLTNALNVLLGAGVPIAELRDPFKELFDTMGLPGERLVEKIGTTRQLPDMSMSPTPDGTSVPMESNKVPTL